MASVELTALIIALIALFISLLQVIQQYASSASTRGKVNRAAIGPMSQKNRYGWSLREWKLRVEYARVDSRAMTASLQTPDRSAEKVEEVFHSRLPEHYFRSSLDSIDGLIKVTVFRLDDPEGYTPVLISTLTPQQRAAISNLQKQLNRIYIRQLPCKATWCNMITDLGIDPREYSTNDYLDADTVPAALDAPIIHIKMADLVKFGFLLDMEINKFDLKSLAIDMIGRDCNITTQYQGAAGMVSRYSGLSPEIRPSALKCTPSEIAMLLYAVNGSLPIGDAPFDFTHMGYNAVEFIFSTVIDRLEGNDWEKVPIPELLKEVEADSGLKWKGRWAEPKAPVVPFLLTICGNLAVANAFPHRILRSWSHSARKIASVEAFGYIQSTLGFVDAPLALFETIAEKKIDLVTMDDYKIANNWGCEYGGMRSWLAGNFSEFVFRMSKCWVVSHMTDRIPILPYFRPYFSDGTLSVELVKSYISDQPPASGGGWWWTNSSSLFWLQIMMFDTWIARRVEYIMGGTGNEDLSVPVDMITVTERMKLGSGGMTRTGWKRSRLTFVRLYLQRLAEGIDGKGASFMTAGERHDNPSDGWSGLPQGKIHDWAAVDAVLTLRAVVMVARLELLKDSTAMLDLRRLNPTVQMA